MKSFGILSVAAMVMSGWITSYGQGIESDVPGDNFSLEGALELFKKSASPEEFEKLLNSPDSKVNNLDLNGDGYIDYIKVLDRYEGNVHAFIIQAVVSETESQDVAVIELEKQSNGKAVLQIVGDEDVYGIETIIEPTKEVRTYAGTTTTHTVVNVWAWPSVQYIYGPRYTVWVSPWGWYHRPVWWHTWRPVAYVHYHPIWRPYRPYYAICHTRRVVYADRIYRPYRTTSVVVRNRHHDQIARYRSSPRDDYRNGRTRNDERRSYNRNDRSSTTNAPQQRREDFDRNRRSSTQREVVPSSNLSTSRGRSAPADIQRNATVQKRDDSQDRRAGTVDNNREVRKQATTPALNRSRSSENPAVPQRRATSERSVPNNNIQRNTTVQKRDASPASSGTVQNKREARQQASPAVNRSRSSGSPAVQKRSSSSNRSSGTRSGETKRGRD